MKYTRQQIKDVSLSAASHAEAMATLYEMIREEIEQERKISRRKIRASVDMTFREHEIGMWGSVEYKLAESVFAAAGWTIVDDEPEPVQDWQPISTAPKTLLPIFLAFRDCQDANGVRGFWSASKQYVPLDGGQFASQPTHWMPIPPLPENDK